MPEQFKQFVEPLIPNIVAGIHEAFSLAIGSMMWIGIGGADPGRAGRAVPQGSATAHDVGNAARSRRRGRGRARRVQTVVMTNAGRRRSPRPAGEPA